MPLEILAVLSSTFDNLNCYSGKNKKGKEIRLPLYPRHLSVHFLHEALVVESCKRPRPATTEVDGSTPISNI